MRRSPTDTAWFTAVAPRTEAQTPEAGPAGVAMLAVDASDDLVAAPAKAPEARTERNASRTLPPHIADGPGRPLTGH
jgi:hypothetical protein